MREERVWLNGFDARDEGDEVVVYRKEESTHQWVRASKDSFVPCRR